MRRIACSASEATTPCGAAASSRSVSNLKTIGSFITGHRARGIDRLSLLGELATLMMQARALAAYRDGRPDDMRGKKTFVN